MVAKYNDDDDGGHGDISTDRRSFFNQAALAAGAFAGVSTMAPQPASAKIFLDPALYGDQELRQSAVNSLKESVRRAVLQNPALAPSFYQLALLDGLSYDIGTGDYGPDGRVIGAVINSKAMPWLSVARPPWKASAVLSSACSLADSSQ